MTNTNVRYPKFEIDLITEDTSYLLEYDTERQLTRNDFEESIISFSVKNAMEDDTPVFSLVILAKDKWDKILGANDLIRIRVIPDAKKGRPDNPYILVGLISDIRKEGEYGDGLLVYRITGMSMAKVLIDFEIGVIRGIPADIADLGWLPDGLEHGIEFSGNSASDIADQIMDRFIYEYANYSFQGGRTIEDFLEHDFDSWTEHEALADATPFVHYEGNIRQFIEDVAAKPFNEFYFEYTPDGKCLAIMRPTPFDPLRWRMLYPYNFTSDIVVEESIGKNDNEAYSVFVVNPPGVIDITGVELGVYPKFHPDLIDKYGYTKLEVENRYLLADMIHEGEEGSVEGESLSIAPPSYEEVRDFMAINGYHNAETLRRQKNQVRSDLMSQFRGMTNSLANNIIDSYLDGSFTQSEYNSMVRSSADPDRGRNVSEERNAAGRKLELFTQKLYNWYCENPNFYSGDIRVLGDPSFRIGTRAFYTDYEHDTTWEFYIESVQHEFSFTNGYTTILGVTRGLPERGRHRFNNLWGQSEDFKGGYLGEPSLEELRQQALLAEQMVRDSMSPGGGWSLAGGGSTAMAALNTARQYVNVPSVYVFGGGRTGSNPFNSRPIRVDCSSFVWWCYYVNGVSLKGGKTGMTTDTIKTDSRLITVSNRGAPKSEAAAKLLQGDLVYFDTYKADGHIGIYAGDGTFIGAQSSSGISVENMDSGYWWDKFNGRVLRYPG